MPLPELIEIVPLDKPVRAEITVPGSKSITNRALILAALAEGEVMLNGALWSEDTQVMTEALRTLGFEVRVEPDPEEFCNRTITVKGLGGKIPNAGTPEEPLKLFVGNAGTAARFLSAMVCLGNGVYHLHGVPRMHERPQAALLTALRELGYRVDSSNDKLPVTIFGRADLLVGQDAQQRVPSKRTCTVSIEESSQFASALLLCATQAGWDVKVAGENAEESPYVAMTTKLIETFPKRGGKCQIEPDASSGSYFWAASCIAPNPIRNLTKSEDAELFGIYMKAVKLPPTRDALTKVFAGPSPFQWWEQIPDAAGVPETETESWIRAFRDAHTMVWVKDWPRSDWQIDAKFRLLLKRTRVSRQKDLGDSVMTAVVLASLGTEESRFTDLGRLRVQECERVVALRTELTKCGAKVIEEGDTLTVYPSKLHSAEIDTYNDHRMAMCFAILGLKVPGIKLQNPACVKKTFPNFFQKLATPPPQGLGATILDGRTGRKLEMDELFAE